MSRGRKRHAKKRDTRTAKRADGTLDPYSLSADVPQSLSPVLDVTKGWGLDSIYTRFRTKRDLQQIEVDGLYQDGIGRRIIDLPVDHALSAWPVLDVAEEWRDQAYEVEALAQRLDVPAHVRKAARLRSKDGWSLVALGYADLAHSQPAPWGYAPLTWVRELYREDCWVEALYGAESPKVGQARLIRNWQIRPDADSDSIGFIPGLGTLHSSRFTRLTTFDGRSDFQLVADHLANLLAGGEGTGGALQRASVGKWSVKNWREQVMRDEETSYKVMQAQHKALSTLNALVLDKDNEDFTMLSNGALSGSKDAVYALSWLLSAAAGIPMTLLYGMSPGGFSGGESEERLWADRLWSLRRDIEPHLRMLYNALWVEVLGVAAVPEYAFEWPPLRQPTTTEKAEVVTAVLGAAEKAQMLGLADAPSIAAGLASTPEMDLWEWTSETPVIEAATGENILAPTVQTTVEELALNGAQIASFVQVLTEVSLGTISPEAAMAILSISFPSADRERLRVAVLAQAEQAARVQQPTAPAPGSPGDPSDETLDVPGADVDEPAEPEPEGLSPAQSEAIGGTWTDPADLAERYSLPSKSTVRSLFRTGEVRGRKVSSRWQYREEDLAAHLLGLSGVADALRRATDAERSEEEKARIREEFRESVNMSPSEIREHAKGACSKEASIKRRTVINRVLRLLEKPQGDWDASDYTDAAKVIGYIARASKIRASEPASSDCPRPVNTYALMNWGHNPDA